ncbi:MAG: hypothetical protein H0U57_02695 [Tatlockia sp.]|nr:hypothetical protein [Tatlockia sp.]
MKIARYTLYAAMFFLFINSAAAHSILKLNQGDISPSSTLTIYLEPIIVDVGYSVICNITNPSQVGIPFNAGSSIYPEFGWMTLNGDHMQSQKILKPGKNTFFIKAVSKIKRQYDIQTPNIIFTNVDKQHLVTVNDCTAEAIAWL